jgi:hypothetical protein
LFVIDREEVENIFPSFKNNHLIKKRLNKVAQETKANSATEYFVSVY